MIVNWKKEKAGVLVIPVMNEGVVVEYASLLPGHNEVDDDKWKAMKETTRATKHIDAGNLVEVFEEVVDENVRRRRSSSADDKEEKKTAKKIKKLTKMTPKKAREIVKDTYVLDTLEKWLDMESRDEIRAVIHSQIEMINNPKKNPKGKK